MSNLLFYLKVEANGKMFSMASITDNVLRLSGQIKQSIGWLPSLCQSLGLISSTEKVVSHPNSHSLRQTLLHFEMGIKIKKQIYKPAIGILLLI